MTVVIAAEGYPGARRAATRSPVSPMPSAPRRLCPARRHRLDGAGQLIAAGGRVLNVVGTGPDLAAARAAAYQAAGKIKMRGGWFRTDIAERAAAATARP